MFEKLQPLKQDYFSRVQGPASPSTHYSATAQRDGQTHLPSSSVVHILDSWRFGWTLLLLRLLLLLSVVLLPANKMHLRKYSEKQETQLFMKAPNNLSNQWIRVLQLITCTKSSYLWFGPVVALELKVDIVLSWEQNALGEMIVTTDGFSANPAHTLVAVDAMDFVASETKNSQNIFKKPTNSHIKRHWTIGTHKTKLQILTSTFTAYLTRNTHLSTPRPKYW